MGMNINLPPDLEDLVRRKMTSGLYTSVSEVVCEAPRLMDEKDGLPESGQNRGRSISDVACLE
jgi:antitoxin ParD1/3/4